jgi:hypothetical protein
MIAFSSLSVIIPHLLAVFFFSDTLTFSLVYKSAFLFKTLVPNLLTEFPGQTLVC